MHKSFRTLQTFINIAKRQSFHSNLSERLQICSTTLRNPYKLQFRLLTSSHSNLCSNTTYDYSPETSKNNTLGKITPKLFLAFTCKVCNTRMEKYISKIAYTKGVVIVRCDKCEENHLIADNLGWFPDLKSARNIEDIMASKGETVKKIADFQIKEVKSTDS